MRKHSHKEAFALMNYACECGHREVFWNERDGVTPFTVPCPSCGDPMGLSHHSFHLDRYAPDHKPWFGQRVFCSMTAEKAERIARARVLSRMKPGKEAEERIEGVAASLYHEGHAPDIRVEGYPSTPDSLRQ